ncbi:MAG: cysteine hydrolase family protein [Armatimonadota bacterium]
MPQAPALILIDLQIGFDELYWGMRNNPEAEGNISKLLAEWRAKGWPVIHVHHHSQNSASPLHPDNPGCKVKPEFAPNPGESVFQKRVNSGFIGTNLQQELRDRGITELVIVGLTTDHCVSTTTRMAANFGFGVKLVSDATATFDRTGPNGKHYTADEMHDLALASLHNEFAEVITTTKLLANL